MAEELRITVVDEGGAGGLPSAPGTPQPTAPPAPEAPPSTPTGEADDGSDFPAAAAGAAAVSGGGIRGAFAAVTKALGPVGVAATAAAAGLAAGASAINAFTAMVERKTSELTDFSAEINAAQLQSIFAREEALLRRADLVGDDLARAERVRSQLETASMDFQTAVLDKVLGVNIAIEAGQLTLAKVMDAASVAIQEGNSMFGTFAGVATAGIMSPAAVNGWKILRDRLAKWVDKELEKEEKGLTLLEELLQQMPAGMNTGIATPQPALPEGRRQQTPQAGGN